MATISPRPQRVNAYDTRADTITVVVVQGLRLTTPCFINPSLSLLV